MKSVKNVGLRLGVVLVVLWGLFAMIDDAHESSQRDDEAIRAVSGQDIIPQKHYIDPPVATSVANSDAKEVPDYADEAASQIEAFLTWDVFKAKCKPVQDKEEWFVACKADGGSPFAVYAVSQAKNSAEEFHLVALTGKSKRFAHQGKMRNLTIDTLTLRNDVDIESIVSKVDN